MTEKPSPFFADVDAVLFDLDGTLIDSAPDLAAAAEKMRARRGLPALPFARYRAMAGAGARGMLGVAFEMKPDHLEYAVYKEEFFVHYENCMTQRTHAFDGVADMIDGLLQKNFLWGVVTNKSARFTEPLTRGMPLFATAGAMVSGDTTPHTKPHPAPLLEAARRLAVDPSRCVYVGDDERDIVAGLAAGMRTVAARYGYLGANGDVSTWGAHAEIAAAHELLPLLGH